MEFITHLCNDTSSNAQNSLINEIHPITSLNTFHQKPNIMEKYGWSKEDLCTLKEKVDEMLKASTADLPISLIAKKVQALRCFSTVKNVKDINTAIRVNGLVPHTYHLWTQPELDIVDEEVIRDSTRTVAEVARVIFKRLVENGICLGDVHEIAVVKYLFDRGYSKLLQKEKTRSASRWTKKEKTILQEIVTSHSQFTIGTVVAVAREHLPNRSDQAIRHRLWLCMPQKKDLQPTGDAVSTAHVWAQPKIDIVEQEVTQDPHRTIEEVANSVFRRFTENEIPVANKSAIATFLIRKGYSKHLMKKRDTLKCASSHWTQEEIAILNQVCASRPQLSNPTIATLITEEKLLNRSVEAILSKLHEIKKNKKTHDALISYNSASTSTTTQTQSVVTNIDDEQVVKDSKNWTDAELIVFPRNNGVT